MITTKERLWLRIQRWLLMRKLSMHRRMMRHYYKAMPASAGSLEEDSNQYLWDYHCYHLNMASITERRIRDLEAALLL
jgi:hypothetical protein